MAKNSVKLIVVGAGGYGHYYLQTLFEKYDPKEVEVVGIVEPYPDGVPILELARQNDIPVFLQLEDLFGAKVKADLAVISSSLQYHASQVILALQQGCHVLVEKPAAVTVQDVDAMIEEEKKSGRWVMVGYQWSFSEAIQKLKQDILSGKFGSFLHGRTLCFWGQDDAYFGRNDWAGKQGNNFDGWILDSPAMNAMSHFLHNLLYLLGDSPETSAIPEEIAAETYRANRIENYDTVACKIRLQGEAPLLYYASQVCENDVNPIFQLKFGQATVTFHDDTGIIAEMEDGESISYGSPEDTDQFYKLEYAISSVQKKQLMLCGLIASRPQVLCVNSIQDGIITVPEFPPTMVRRDNVRKRWWVDGLGEDLELCYSRYGLPSDMGFYWSANAKQTRLVNYEFFPRGTTPKCEL
ncbi:MAG: Gfo/Idh/MocA family oxidoreductase [bacterium]